MQDVCDPLRSAKLQQEQTRRELSEDRSLEQAKRAAAVNAEVVRANTFLKQQQRLSKMQAWPPAILSALPTTASLKLHCCVHVFTATAFV